LFRFVLKKLNNASDKGKTREIWRRKATGPQLQDSRVAEESVRPAFALIFPRNTKRSPSVTK
jgi:hypothetical protein